MIDRTILDKTIRQNLYDGNFCVDRFSDILNISPSYLRQCVQRHYRISPHALIRKLRLKRALELYHEQTTIRDIGLSVGYVNERSFRNAFYKEFGVAPSKYFGMNMSNQSKS